MYSSTILDEEHILRQTLKDTQAFKPIYEKYYRQIFLFILHRTGEKETSADLSQQVFLKALVALPHYTFRGLPFSSWLYRIAINECNGYFRKTKKERWVVLDEGVGELHDELLADVHPDDLEKHLPSILQKLPEKDLQIIELRFFEKRSFREVAEITGMSEVNAKIKTYRVIRKMKKYFEKP